MSGELAAAFQMVLPQACGRSCVLERRFADAGCYSNMSSDQVRAHRFEDWQVQDGSAVIVTEATSASRRGAGLGHGRAIKRGGRCFSCRCHQRPVRRGLASPRSGWACLARLPPPIGGSWFVVRMVNCSKTCQEKTLTEIRSFYDTEHESVGKRFPLRTAAALALARCPERRLTSLSLGGGCLSIKAFPGTECR